MSWHQDVPGSRPHGSDVVASEEVVLLPEPRNVGIARHWVADRLPLWASPDVRDAAILMTSELVTNGVMHARTQMLLGIALTDQTVAVGVHDLDLGRRELPGPERFGGRGLALVASLASDWGQVQHVGGGKTVWFRLPR